jgi:hypothetical protein
MDCESVCLREIGGDEFDAAFHELRDQSDVGRHNIGCESASECDPLFLRQFNELPPIGVLTPRPVTRRFQPSSERK